MVTMRQCIQVTGLLQGVVLVAVVCKNQNQNESNRASIWYS
jgi:hypothetical protein